jgi:hypothetical protein
MRRSILAKRRPAPPSAAANDYGQTFRCGFPMPEIARQIRDDADLTLAINAYKCFFPAVSAAAARKAGFIWANNINYWKELHELISTAPPFHMHEGQIAALGIGKDKPFNPDKRMKGILEKAALMGNAQMRMQSFASRRPEHVSWPDRKRKWASPRPESGNRL